MEEAISKATLHIFSNTHTSTASFTAHLVLLRFHDVLVFETADRASLRFFRQATFRKWTSGTQRLLLFESKFDDEAAIGARSSAAGDATHRMTAGTLHRPSLMIKLKFARDNLHFTTAALSVSRNILLNGGEQFNSTILRVADLKNAAIPRIRMNRGE